MPGEPGADGLLIGSGHTDIGPRVGAPVEEVHGGGTLPAGGGDQTLPEDSARAQARPGPITPGIQFGPVRAGVVPEAVAKQVPGARGGQLLAHPAGGVVPGDTGCVSVGTADGLQFRARGEGLIAYERDGPGACGENGTVVEVPQGICEEPVQFPGADDEACVHTRIDEPVRRESQTLEEGGGIPYESVERGGLFQQGGDVAGDRGKNRFREEQRTGGCGVLERLLKEPAGVLDAAGIKTGHNSYAPDPSRYGSRHGVA